MASMLVEASPGPRSGPSGRENSGLCVNSNGHQMRDLPKGYHQACLSGDIGPRNSCQGFLFEPAGEAVNESITGDRDEAS